MERNSDNGKREIIPATEVQQQQKQDQQQQHAVLGWWIWRTSYPAVDTGR